MLGSGPCVILILCGFVAFTTGRFMLSLLLLFVPVLFQSYLPLGAPRLGKRQLVFVLLGYCLFILHALNYVLFPSS